jgi:hypothetical protein
MKNFFKIIRYNFTYYLCRLLDRSEPKKMIEDTLYEKNI